MTEGFDLGGGGGNAFSFGPQGSQPGAYVAGKVIDMKEVQESNYDTKELEFWPNGDPKMQYRVTLQTDLRDPANPSDTGARDIYLNGYRKPHPKSGTSGTLYAVLEAVKASTGGTQLQRGGRLTLQWVSGMGFTGDPRHYQAWYEPPVVDLAAGQPPAAPQPAAAPAPVAQAPAATPAPGAPVAQTPVQQVQVPPPVAAPAAPAAPAAVAPPVQQQIPTPAAAPAAPAPVAQAPAPAPAAPGAPTAEQIAALHAAGITDPAKIREIYPAYTG